MVSTFHSLIDPQDEVGAPCLSFANTLDWHASAQPVETLHDYGDLVSWAQQSSLLNPGAGAILLSLAEQQCAAATKVYNAAITLREAIYRTFRAINHATAPSSADLALINQHYRAAANQLELVESDNTFCWHWQTLNAALDAPLWPVAWSTVELLTSPWLARVKVGEDTRGCGYLFIDTSKNRSRRWCSMESCGNRAKVQRHRARRQET